MSVRRITDHYSVSPQIVPQDVAGLKAQGFRSVFCFRPDGETPDQTEIRAVEAAVKAEGLEFLALPVKAGTTPDAKQVQAVREALLFLPGPVLGYCRSGTRAAQAWALAEAKGRSADEVLAEAGQAGFDLGALRPLMERAGEKEMDMTRTSGKSGRHFQVLVVGGGAGGISAAASLLKRDSSLKLGIVEPSDVHFYQPGWTLVGAGVFQAEQTRKNEKDLIPSKAVRLKNSVTEFLPDQKSVVLNDGAVVSYDILVVALGLTLDWNGIPGLAETLGKNGVTSNYRYDLAPYTWQLVSQLKGGTAIFTQPPMPIKCAGAPQKALYLSCDEWRRQGVLKSMKVEFNTCTPGLFGVKDFVPALMEYIKGYGVDLHLESKLVEVNGPARVAVFERKGKDGVERVERHFDMLHVVPPQVSPAVVRSSALAAANGFVDVDMHTLQHKRYPDVFALGDVIDTTCAKTAAAVRVQAPVVATNVLAALKQRAPVSGYEGYGACPLTVENGKIVLAEFSYGGKLAPTMPTWLLNGKRPTRMAWWLKKYIMPPLYWWAMLRGHELMVAPKPLKSDRG